MSGDQIWPILFAVSACANVALLWRPVMKLLRRGDQVSEDNIMAMVEEGEESGAIQANEKEFIENVFEFDNMTAKDVMVHRTDMVTLSLDEDPDAILDTIRQSGLSRFPVYGDDVDDILGILSTREYLLNFHLSNPKPLKELLRPAYFVPETVQADVLFRDMQGKKIHMALVVDEYGGTSGLVTLEDLLEELAGEYNASEEIWAGYVRWDQKFGNDKTLVLGLRLENTHTDYQGYEYFYQEEVEDENTGAILTPESESLTQGEKHDKSYLNVLPSVIFKWDVQNDFKVRAAFTNTLARPKYEALVPSIQINRGDDELYMGNPDLNATLSYNLDLSAEKYFSSIGLVSAGIFYKRVNDLITDRTQLDYEYMGYLYEEFKQPQNIGDANVFGVEVALQRDLGFLHPALSCVGLYGNYTYTYSNVSNFNVLGRENEGDMRMPGSPEHTANASLSFEKWGLSARLSYNFASAFLDELGDSKYEDRYYDKVSYMDLNLGYTFDKKYTIYFEANNLLNQPLRYYQGEKDRTMQVEYYGVKLNAGFKINF